MGTDLDVDELREIVDYAASLSVVDMTPLEVAVSRVLPLLLSELTELRASLAAATARGGTVTNRPNPCC